MEGVYAKGVCYIQGGGLHRGWGGGGEGREGKGRGLYLIYVQHVFIYFICSVYMEGH